MGRTYSWEQILHRRKLISCPFAGVLWFAGGVLLLASLVLMFMPEYTPQNALLRQTGDWTKVLDWLPFFDLGVGTMGKALMLAAMAAGSVAFMVSATWELYLGPLGIFVWPVAIFASYLIILLLAALVMFLLWVFALVMVGAILIPFACFCCCH